jgi:hypothetical protein
VSLRARLPVDDPSRRDVIGFQEFTRASPRGRVGVSRPGQAQDVTEIFTLVGFALVALLGVTRWWEEREPRD